MFMLPRDLKQSVYNKSYFPFLVLLANKNTASDPNLKDQFAVNLLPIFI